MFFLKRSLKMKLIFLNKLLQIIGSAKKHEWEVLSDFFDEVREKKELMINQTISDLYYIFGPEFIRFKEPIRNGIEALLGELYVASVIKEYTEELAKVEQSFRTLISSITNAYDELILNRMSPWDAYKIIEREKTIDKKRKEMIENIIATNAQESYKYAREILKGPFPKGEDSIAQDPEYSFFYARDVLKKPFPKGEDAIATDPVLSYEYAEKVLKGPFPKGENVIAQKSILSYLYAKNILKQPFPKGEDAIATDPAISLRYAIDVLHRPFPKGEKAIATNDNLYTSYKIYFEKFWKDEEKDNN